MSYPAVKIWLSTEQAADLMLILAQVPRHDLIKTILVATREQAYTAGWEAAGKQDQAISAIGEKEA